MSLTQKIVSDLCSKNESASAYAITLLPARRDWLLELLQHCVVATPQLLW